MINKATEAFSHREQNGKNHNLAFGFATLSLHSKKRLSDDIPGSMGFGDRRSFSVLETLDNAGEWGEPTLD